MCDVFLCFVTFRYGVLGQVWYLIVSIPDICYLPYFQDRLLNGLFSDSTSVLEAKPGNIDIKRRKPGIIFTKPVLSWNWPMLSKWSFWGEGAVGLSANIPVLSFFYVIIFVTQLETI